MRVCVVVYNLLDFGGLEEFAKNWQFACIIQAPRLASYPLVGCRLTINIFTACVKII